MHEQLPRAEMWGVEKLLHVSPAAGEELVKLARENAGSREWQESLIKKMESRNAISKTMMASLQADFNFHGTEAEYFQFGFAAAHWLLNTEAEMKVTSGLEETAALTEANELEPIALPKLNSNSNNRYRGLIEGLQDIDRYDEYRDWLDDHLVANNRIFITSLDEILRVQNGYGAEDKYAFFVGAISFYDVVSRHALREEEKDLKQKVMNRYSGRVKDRIVKPEDFLQAIRQKSE